MYRQFEVGQFKTSWGSMVVCMERLHSFPISVRPGIAMVRSLHFRGENYCRLASMSYINLGSSANSVTARRLLGPGGPASGPILVSRLASGIAALKIADTVAGFITWLPGISNTKTEGSTCDVWRLQNHNIVLVPRLIVEIQ